LTATGSRVALVTGASSGIGHAISLELARRGYDLVVTARRTQLLEALADEVRSAYGRQVEVISADLGMRPGVMTVADRIAEGVDVVVANAGFSTRGPFARLPVEAEVAEVELNVLSTLQLCHAAARVMSRRGRGHILVTSSAASFQPLPGLATYGASKAFVTSLALALAAELRPVGVSVTCLAPGYTVKVRGAARPRPAWLWSGSEEVARAAVDGMLAGRQLVVPGLPAKLIAVLAPRVPRFVVRRLATAVGRRMADRGTSPSDQPDEGSS
jgi:uncharacterized protein